MPAALALVRQAVPLSASRSTMIRTLTGLATIASQILPKVGTSPWAFWMSDAMPASGNAFASDGRSLFSQRAEDLVSGRITPTEPLAPPDVAADADPPVALVLAPALALLPPPELLLLQAARATAATARAVAPIRERLRIVRPDPFGFRAWVNVSGARRPF